MSSCRREEFIQAFLDGESPPEMAEAMRRHLADCAVCAAVRDEMERTLGLLGDVIRAETSKGVPTARLRAALGSKLTKREIARVSMAQLLWRFGFVATASLILLGLAGWFIGRARPSAVPAVKDPSTTTAKSPPPEEKDPLMVSTAPPSSKRVVVRRPPVKGPEEREIVTRFYSLREGEDIRSLDSVQVVRIEVPSSALAEVGLPVDPVMRDEPIMADVVLGHDGLARAIRFVR